MSFIARSIDTLRKIGRDEFGSILPMFAFATGVITVSAGIAIDYSMYSSQRDIVQQALDEAVLSGARLNDTDAERTKRAKAFFDSRMQATKLTLEMSNENFSIDQGITKLDGRVVVTYAGTVGHLTGAGAMSATLSSSAAIAKPMVRQLDLVMCIDATGSMGNTLAAVKSNALKFETNLNAEIAKRGITPFEAMRVRVIFFRDYAGSYNGSETSGTWVLDGGRWVYKTLKASDPEYWKNIGDDPPLKTSAFFPLPANRGDFSTFVNPETATGGGDAPESGLECVNEAMNSAWAKLGSNVETVNKPLDAIFPVIVVWTDAAAHMAGYSPSLKSPLYPSEAAMPRTTAGLRAKWVNSAVVDQHHKLLIFFGNPDVVQSDYFGQAKGWADVKTWPDFIIGGTLTQGNQQMVSRIADAIATKVPAPYLSH